MKKLIVAALIGSSSLVSLGAQAQPRERFHTQHWVFDSRFHHNHYYPEVGYSLTVLPEGHVVVNFRGGRFFYHSGVWYQPAPAGYVVVRPPVGVIVPVLPPAYTTVWVAGAPYYYANDVYYVSAPGGYAVAAPPTVAAAPTVIAPQAPPPQAPPPGPQAAAPAAPSGVWYYCDSSKTYYPYVSECREGWRQVPAAPPR